jgi:hypothetical protein
MRWFRIRKAKIANKDREEFEQFGVATIQSMLASGNLNELKNDFPIGGAPLSSRSTLSLIQFELFQKKPAALAWLVEQYDRQERKETWSITMEAAITVFVLAELVLALTHR